MNYLARAKTAFFQTFLQRVFTWMLLGLLTTGAVAAAIGSNDALLTDITETPGLVIAIVNLFLFLPPLAPAVTT